jgi:hypothetical protein
MSVDFTSYDDEGRVISVGRCSNPEEQSGDVGGFIIGEWVNGDEFYFDPSNGYKKTARPSAPAISLSASTVVANGRATLSLRGVPTGALVKLGEESLIADGDIILLSTQLVGQNSVIVESFPNKRWTGEFNGTAT